MGRGAGRGDAAARVGFGVNLGSLSVFLERAEPFGRARRRERCRAIPFRRRGRAIEVGAREVLFVVRPGRSGVVAAVLRRSFWVLQSSHTCEAREEKRDSNLHGGGVGGLSVGGFLVSERLQTRFSSAVSAKRNSVP